MAMTKNKSTEENRKFWAHVEKIAERVRHWPKWMGGGGEEPFCCPHCNCPYDKSPGMIAGQGPDARIAGEMECKPK